VTTEKKCDVPIWGPVPIWGFFSEKKSKNIIFCLIREGQKKNGFLKNRPYGNTTFIAIEVGQTRIFRSDFEHPSFGGKKVPHLDIQKFPI